MNSYDDKTMMTDMLSTQKFIAQNYNSYAGECATKQSKSKLMKILGEEHDIQFEIFEQMNAKGWYKTPEAPQDKINQAIQQHISGATNVAKASSPSKASAKTAAKNTKTSKTQGKKTSSK